MDGHQPQSAMQRSTSVYESSIFWIRQSSGRATSEEGSPAADDVHGQRQGSSPPPECVGNVTVDRKLHSLSPTEESEDGDESEQNPKSGLRRWLHRYLVTRRRGTLAAPFNSSVRCSRATAYDGVVGSHLGRRFSTPGGTCLRCFGARLIWALPIRLDQLSGPGTYVILFELVPEPVNGQYRGRPLQAAFTDICG